ncbi:hypothetical protein C2U68_00530 [Methylomonas koyamae]|nr:hypothetical protein C2U68_00530 [Methylomonas koyamae]
MFGCAEYVPIVNPSASWRSSPPKGSGMKQSHALAYLRQICCSGLSRELAIGEFLKTLPLVVPSNSNTFSVGDSQLRPVYHIAGFELADMAATAPEIIAAYHTPERQRRANVWFASHPCIGDPRVMEQGFYATDLYHLIYRRFDMHHVLWLPLQLDGGAAGVLGLYRPQHQKPFDGRDQTRVLSLLPYLAHAFRAGNDSNFQLGPPCGSGMLVMDTQGKTVFQSPEATRLLELARYPRLLRDMRGQDRLLAKLAELCRNLLGIYRGEDAPPPSFSHHAATGQYLFKAYWLNGCGDQPERLIGVTVEYRQPLTLKLLRALRDQPLSPAQREVALLLAQGEPFEKIGQRLHIKMTTVRDHIGKIYTKLNIHQREELLPKLLAASASSSEQLYPAETERFR